MMTRSQFLQVFAVIGAILATEPAISQTVTVTTLEDIVDFAGTQQVANLPGPDGMVSFREAVIAVNNTPGPQTIEFAIPSSTFWLGSNVALLRVENAPGGFTLTDDATTVDFTSQTRNVGDTNPSGNEVGIFSLMSNFTLPQGAITLAGNNCTIRGLDQVQNFGYAILILGNGNHVVGCHFYEPFGGITYAAVAIRPFTATPAVGNWIGGTSPGDGNFIASYPGVGIEITGPASDNVVVGNTLTQCHIAGLLIQAGATNTRVGGATAAERNVISGNGTGGNGVPQYRDVELDGVDGTHLEGNFLGTTLNGMGAAAPPAIGIEMHGCQNTAILNNVVSGYYSEGLHQGQRFRTGIGVYVGTGANGVPSVATTIRGNLIGVAADGMSPLPDAEGVRIDPSFALSMNVLIGGSNPGDSNTIARNAGAGVTVFGGATGVTISRNSIYGNGAPTSLYPAGSPSIDLIGDSGIGGVTSNDPLDPDTGGNALQNFPILSFAKYQSSGTVIRGHLNSLPSQAFVIEFFSAPNKNPLGVGEGKVFLGSIQVTTDATGNATFSTTVNQRVRVGDFVCSTATQVSTGNTSEFSPAVAIQRARSF